MKVTYIINSFLLSRALALPAPESNEQTVTSVASEAPTPTDAVPQVNTESHDGINFDTQRYKGEPMFFYVSADGMLYSWDGEDDEVPPGLENTVGKRSIEVPASEVNKKYKMWGPWRMPYNGERWAEEPVFKRSVEVPASEVNKKYKMWGPWRMPYNGERWAEEPVF